MTTYKVVFISSDKSPCFEQTLYIEANSPFEAMDEVIFRHNPDKFVCVDAVYCEVEDV